MSDAAPPAECDVVVVGAGVAGLCAALWLAREGRSVTVLERGAPWGESSGANAGTLSVQVKRPEVWSLTRLGVDLWQRLAEEGGADLGFARPGSLRVATSEAERLALVASVDAQASAGLDVQLLEGAALRGLAPWLGETVLAAGLCSHDGYCSPLRAGPALLSRLRTAGGRVFGHCPVTAIDGADGAFRVHAAGFAVGCRTLLVAAGAWSDEVAALLGVTLPVLADVNMLSVTEPAPPLLDRVVVHAGGVLSLKQYPNGSVLIGGGWQGRGGLHPDRREIDHDNLLHNLRTAAGVVPALAGLRVLRSWSGFEGVAPDALPLLGPLPGFERVFVLACARGGYSQAPAQALLVAEMVAGRATTLPVGAFAPARLRVAA